MNEPLTLHDVSKMREAEADGLLDAARENKPLDQILARATAYRILCEWEDDLTYAA